MIDPQRLAELLDAHAAALELYAAQWAENPEDVVQVAFIRLAEQVETPTNEVAWLYKVVRNGAISSGRSFRRRKRYESVAAWESESWFQTNSEDEIDGQTATDALRRLPADDREVVVARIWGGLTFDEIAELIGASASTAHRRYESALDELRKHVGENGVRLGPEGPYTTAKKGDRNRPDTNRPRPDGPEVFRSNLGAAVEPRPSLKYVLVPRFQDRLDGNAAPYYYRALLSMRTNPAGRLKPLFEDKNYNRWMSGNPTAIPKEEIRTFLKSFERTFENLKIASHRTECDWSWRVQDLKGPAAIAFIIDEVQECRNLARLVILKVRLAIAEKRIDDAIEWMQVGYKLAVDVAEPPLLINDLVGVAIAQMMTAEVRNLIAQPGSPNMYWALASLPSPVVDIRPAMRYEMSLPMKMFPELKDAETAQRSPAEWSEVLSRAVANIMQMQSSSGLRRSVPMPSMQSRLVAAGMALRGYPQAKRDLVEWGMSQKAVDAMPVGQVIVIHQARVYRHMYQELMKWSLLPYRDAQEGLKRSEARLTKDGYFGSFGRTKEIIPLTSLLLPSTAAAYRATARVDVRIAGLRVLEAIRMHAANNQGRLPASLSEISAADNATAAAHAKAVAPYLDGGSYLVARVDITKLRVTDLMSVLNNIVPATQQKRNMQEARRLDGLLEQLRGQKVNEFLFAINLGELPVAQPVVILPVGPGGNHHTVAALMFSQRADGPTSRESARELGQETGSPFELCTRLGDAVFCGRQTQFDRLKTLKPVRRPNLVKAFQAAGDDALQVVFLPGSDHLRVITEMVPKLPKYVGGGSGADLVNEIRWIALGASAPPQLAAHVTIQSKNAAAAKSLERRAKLSLEMMARNPQLRQLIKPIDSIRKMLTPKVDGSRLTISIDAKGEKFQSMLAMFAVPVSQARASAQRASSTNNLKQIGIALHNFHDVHKSFPPHSSYDKRGKKLLSWRVFLLPYLENAALFEQFRLNEPWDSEHNKKLIAKMPQVFADPTGQTKGKGKTRYVAPVGASQSFTGKPEGVRIREITDGTSNTIMILEVAPKQAVIWTKPDDHEVDLKAVMKGLVGENAKGFLTAFCDGSVRFLSKSIKPETLKAMFTRNGGEIINEN
eukprot:g12538.t1